MSKSKEAIEKARLLRKYHQELINIASDLGLSFSELPTKQKLVEAIYKKVHVDSAEKQKEAGV